MRAAGIALGLALGLAGCLAVPEEGDDELPVTGPTAGLVAYWSMDRISDDKRVRDAIGGHHAECVNCPTPYAAYVGDGALRFRGGDSLHVPASPAFDLPAGSVSVWVYVEDVPGTLIALPADDLYNSWLVSLESSAVAALEYPGELGATGGLDYSTATVVVGAWNHVAATWDAGSRQLVVNGTVASFAPQPHRYSALPLVLGADVDFDNPAYFFTGAIDDVRVYDRVLSLGELGQLFDL